MMNDRFFQLALRSMLLLTTAVAVDDSADQRFLAGLRQRGLYRLAETYCLERLDPLRYPDLADSQRADLVIELSRCLAERAVASPAEVRPPLWQRALQVTKDFAGRYPRNPRLPLVRFQAALGLLARGELARQEAEVTADRGNLLDEARTHLRAAVGQLRELAGEVERRRREQSLSEQATTAGLTTDELNSLAKNIRYQLARALRNQGQCYDAESPDRANSLTQAVKLLEPLAKLDPVDPLAWKSRVDLIVSHRLLADYAAAGRQLEALSASKPTPCVALRARAERIRLELAAGQVPKATALIPGTLDLDGVTSADLDYAVLQAYLAEARAASRRGDQNRAALRQAKATEMVERIEQLHGPYWTRRAGMLLARYVQALPRSGDLAMLVRAAESSYRSGRLDDAITTYDHARQLAARQGSYDRAFQLGYVAATIEHRRGRHLEAKDRYQQIAVTMPKHSGAPDAHLLAIYHAGQLAKQQPQDSMDDYAALLREHLQIWPEGPSAEKVRRSLARLHEHRRQWKDAIDVQRKISPADAEYLSSVEAAARCYQAWFEERKASGEPPERIAADAAEAADWFESLVFGPQGQQPQRWSPLERFAALAAARLRLSYTPRGYRPAQDLLSLALRGAVDAPPEWKATARALSVFALAGSGRRREAGEVLSQIAAGPPEELLEMVHGLGRTAADAQPNVRRELAELQLRTIDLLGPRHARLSPSQQETLERVRVRALADAGRAGEALRAYRLLAAKYPRDGTIQEEYARLLSTRKDPASMEAALAKWRELEKKSPPRSRRWFRAKYQVARLHCELGNKQQAAKIIKLLKLLHPELGGPEMKVKFEELLQRCQ